MVVRSKGRFTLASTAERLESLFVQHRHECKLGPDENAFSVASNTILGNHLVGYDVNRLPCVFLEHRGTIDNKILPSIRFRNLQVMLSAEFELIRGGNRAVQKLSLIRCCSPEPGIQKAFFSVVGGIIDELGPEPSGDKIQTSLSRVIELFSRLEAQPSRTVQGLWAELFVMLEYGRTHDFVAAWREATTSTFDFTFPEFNLEVKSTLSSLRKHRFAHEQLQATCENPAFIASILVRRTPNGASLGALADKVRSKIRGHVELAERFEFILFDSLGSSYVDAMSACYDDKYARQHMSIFDASAAPKILSEIPPEVSCISYDVDLSNCKSISIDDVFK